MTCVLSAIRHTAQHGVRARELHGKAVWSQFLEQISLGAREGIPSRSYYLFSLFEQDRKELAPKFVHYHENFYLTAPFVTHPERQTLNCKLRFHDFCRKLNLPTPPILAVFRNGTSVNEIELPSSDIIIKPLSGFSGKMIERWVFDENGEYAREGQGSLSREAFMGYLEHRSQKGDQLVQPRLFNHRNLAGLSMGGLCTARVVTVRLPDEKPELVASMMRMPRGNSVVDNFSAGGLACPVDMTTGVLRGTAVGWRPLAPGHDVHPETSQKIDGVQLPDWEQAVQLCIMAHTPLVSCPAIGWDIAFTAEGPLLIEGNLPFGIELTQFVSGTPLLATRFLEAQLKYIELNQ